MIAPEEGDTVDFDDSFAVLHSVSKEKETENDAVASDEDDEADDQSLSLPLRRTRRANIEERQNMPQCFRAGEDSSARKDEKRRRFRLLAYGDSLTAGYYCRGSRFAPYGKSLAKALAAHCESEIWVCGLSGLTAAELVWEQQHHTILDSTGRRGMGLKHILETFEPFDLALIMIGTNDLGHGLECDDIIESIQCLHEACHEFGTPTVALSIPDNMFAQSDEEYAGAWQVVNSALENWATSPSSTDSVRAYVDVSKVVPWSRERVCNGGLFDDPLHFSAAGSNRLGAFLADVVRHHLGQSPALEREGWRDLQMDAREET